MWQYMLILACLNFMFVALNLVVGNKWTAGVNFLAGCIATWLTWKGYR